MHMKKIFLTALTIAISLCSCMNHEDADGYNDTAIRENAQKIFGDIDPSQDWSSINKGVIKVTADADLKDIAKVMILTESPFGNSNAKILNTANVKKGETVQMAYDAPNIYDVLFAACVDSKGNYFVQVFNVRDKEVNFAEPASARMNRAGETFPDPADVKLGAPAKSLNTLRAEDAQANPDKYTLIWDQAGYSNNVHKGAEREYPLWADGSWKDERLWTAQNGSSNGWTISNGAITKAVTDNMDLNTLKWLVNYYLPKTGGEIVTSKGNKSNNWKSIVEGTNYFKQYKNHFVCNGQPLTIIPLQMNTTEGQYNNIYYYYFPASKLEEYKDDDAALANYIKTLPKFKAFNGKEQKEFQRTTQYLLPYYGDGQITENMTAVSASIPEGYLVGFMNQKANGESIHECMNGCTYGFGPLNIENNHIFGHYFSAMSTDVSMESVKHKTDGTKEKQVKYGETPYGMDFDSPRIGIFNANNKSFMCFEDGCDCNFSDMIIEICSGVDAPSEPIEPEAMAYTMCFEDRLEEADYDMNDVVLRGVRLDENQIEITLIACGAYDELQIQGLYNSKKLTSKEVHKFFNVTPGTEFINTEKGKKVYPYVSEKFNINNSVNMEDFMRQIYVINKTTGKRIEVPKKGEPPYAIIVPQNFNYPVEFIDITKAYPLFKNWAQNSEVDKDWFKTENEDKTYPNSFANPTE